MRIFKGKSGKEYRVLFSFNAIVNFEEVTRLKMERLNEVAYSPKLVLQFFRFALEAGEEKKFSEKEAGEAFDDIMKKSGWNPLVEELFVEFRKAFGLDSEETKDTQSEAGNDEN